MAYQTIILTMVLLGTGHAAPRVDRVSILEQGVLTAKIHTTPINRVDEDEPGLAIEAVKRDPGRNILRPRNPIPGLAGTSFGYRFKIHGEPQSAPVTLDIVVRYPSPGHKSKKTGKYYLEDGGPSSYKIGQEALALIDLEKPEDVIIGTYVLEVRKDGRVLASASFNVSRAQPPRAINLDLQRGNR